MLTNARDHEMKVAMERLNLLWDGNIRFNNYCREGKHRIRFTLRVNNSSGPGSRRGHTGRKLINACWHVHGQFFDILFDINPKIWIKTGSAKITIDNGNWIDRNIGSVMQPLYFSQACDC